MGHRPEARLVPFARDNQHNYAVSEAIRYTARPIRPTPSADMIAFQGVSKSFDEGRDFAVRDVSFSVASRAFVALVGDSGSGKTTLLKMINRLIEPDQGTVSGCRRVRAVHGRLQPAAADRLRLPGHRAVSSHERRGEHRRLRLCCWTGRSRTSRPARLS